MSLWLRRQIWLSLTLTNATDGELLQAGPIFLRFLGNGRITDKPSCPGRQFIPSFWGDGRARLVPAI